MKRVLSALLCILMIVSVFASGTTAYAEKGGGGESGIKLTYDQAKAVYDKVETFDHVDVRLYGTFTTADGTEKSATVSNPSITIYKEDGTVYRTETFTNTTEYEWRMTGLKVPKSAKIVVTCDVTVDDVTKKDMTFTYEGEEDFIQAIMDCDFGQGLDFNIAGAEVQQQFYYYVTYHWTGLPDNLEELPTDINGYLPNEEVTVDTSFKSGDTCKDKEGNVYTFSGWTEYEQGGVRTSLGDAASFTITGNANIYGVWSVTPLTTDLGSINITKQFEGLPNELRPEAISFTVKDSNDSETTVTLNAENGWSATISGLSEGTYTITEGAADVDGYVYASNFTGDSTTVTLTKSALDTDTNKYTVSSETVTFKNTYTRLGSLKIVKDFGADSELNEDSANIGKFVFTVVGPDGFETRTIELPIASSETPWEFTLENLPAGDYTVTEDPASAARDSYVLTINGAEAGDDAVVAAVANGSTAEAKITNTYTKNISGEIHNPASFKIVKIDGQDNKLSGAEFTLYDEDGSVVSTQTTDSKGEAVFGGFTKAAEYTLKETKAPEGYVATEQTWTVTVKLKDGDPTIQISEDGKFWNKIYN